MAPQAPDGPEHRPPFPACIFPQPGSLPHSHGSGFEQEGETSWSNVKGPGELGEGDTLEVSLRLEDHLFPGPGQHEGGPGPASIHHHLTGCLPTSPPTPASSRSPTPSNHRQRTHPAQDHSGPEQGRGRGRQKASETHKRGVSGECRKIVWQSGAERAGVQQCSACFGKSTEICGCSCQPRCMLTAKGLRGF